MSTADHFSKPFLYVNSHGEPHRRHSFSAGKDYDKAPLKYYLRRIVGWRELDDKAYFMFGRALEEAIRYYHDHDGQGGVEAFAILWALHKDNPEIKYTKTEKDWESLNKAGQEMMRLYVIKQPSLPIPLGGGSVFQREYIKEVFPGDPNYGEIEDFGKLDIVCYVDPAHPLLAKEGHWDVQLGQRPVIVDIKTGARDFPDVPGIAAFHEQLRRYSWQSGISDVAILHFKKSSHALKKGTKVTLLVDAGSFKAGDEVVVAWGTLEGGEVRIVANEEALEAMAGAQGKKEDGKTNQTKAAKEKGAQWLRDNAPLVSATDVTRQKLRFNAGFVTPESAADAGEVAARQIVQIVNSRINNKWPQTFGIEDHKDPYFRAFVLKDEDFKKENFRQSDEDLFDDLFEADELEEAE